METRVGSRACACVALLLFALHASLGHEHIKLQEDEETAEEVKFRTPEEDQLKLRAPEGDVRVQVSGRALVPGVRTQDWVAHARVLLDGDTHVGFIREDGGFSVSDVPSGSYVLEISSPTYRFQPVRVDITATGKMRARVVDYIRTSEVIRLPYPLQMRCLGLHSYFIQRETWIWSDFLMNPMVLMMVLPLLIIVLLPKVMNSSDPEMKREMEQSMNMLNSNQDLPDVSEIVTRFFSPPKSHGRAGGGARASVGVAQGVRGGASSVRGGAPRRRSKINTAVTSSE
ncbi:ER membrane protein complex subunit 7-like isoform X1 [Rhinichthys klamathensis goyatoka]|uniref:ER membrane protein complex subunit 7-like isoform X1 n=1 Tax=Rhinichthys klamathensis goyatoka TaxID=3034132 RepID=UPI0024B584C2|nr:ER membrane protein complex subunit 7-like isoform X1 [Rhinichthys klamathensis goyatoka]